MERLRRGPLVLLVCFVCGCEYLHRVNSMPVESGRATAANPAAAPSTARVGVHVEGFGSGAVADAVTAALVAGGCRIESTNYYQVVYEKDAPAIHAASGGACGHLTDPVYWITAIFVEDSLGVAVTASRDLISNPRTECMVRTPAPTADLEKLLQSVELEMESRSP